MASSTRPNMLQGLRESLPCSAVCLTEVIQGESRRVMINMKQILLLLILYSPLSTGKMIFIVSSIHSYLHLTMAPRQREKWSWWSWVPVCGIASFISSPTKEETVVIVSLTAYLLKPLASHTPVVQRPDTPECFLMGNHSPCSSPSSLSLFHLRLVSSLLWSPLFGLSSR